MFKNWQEFEAKRLIVRNTSGCNFYFFQGIIKAPVKAKSSIQPNFHHIGLQACITFLFYDWFSILLSNVDLAQWAWCRQIAFQRGADEPKIHDDCGGTLSAQPAQPAQAKLGDINARILRARGICIVLQGATAMVTIVHPVRELSLSSWLLSTIQI